VITPKLLKPYRHETNIRRHPMPKVKINQPFKAALVTHHEEHLRASIPTQRTSTTQWTMATATTIQRIWTTSNLKIRHFPRNDHIGRTAATVDTVNSCRATVGTKALVSAQAVLVSLRTLHSWLGSLMTRITRRFINWSRGSLTWRSTIPNETG